MGNSTRKWSLDGRVSDLPIPPGEYLAEVLSEPGLTQAELARAQEQRRSQKLAS